VRQQSPPTVCVELSHGIKLSISVWDGIPSLSGSFSLVSRPFSLSLPFAVLSSRSHRPVLRRKVVSAFLRRLPAVLGSVSSAFVPFPAPYLYSSLLSALNRKKGKTPTMAIPAFSPDQILASRIGCLYPPNPPPRSHLHPPNHLLHPLPPFLFLFTFFHSHRLMM